MKFKQTTADIVAKVAKTAAKRNSTYDVAMSEVANYILSLFYICYFSHIYCF